MVGETLCEGTSVFNILLKSRKLSRNPMVLGMVYGIVSRTLVSQSSSAHLTWHFWTSMEVLSFFVDGETRYPTRSPWATLRSRFLVCHDSFIQHFPSLIRFSTHPASPGRPVLSHTFLSFHSTSVSSPSPYLVPRWGFCSGVNIFLVSESYEGL